MFLQAAGHADVVDPQEAAAGEGDIPGGVRREHGLRAPLEAEGAGGKQQQPRRNSEDAGRFPRRLGTGGTDGKRCRRGTDCGTRQSLPLGERRRRPALYAAARPSDPPPTWPPPLGSRGAGGSARPLLPTLPPVNPLPAPGIAGPGQRRPEAASAEPASLSERVTAARSAPNLALSRGSRLSFPRGTS